MATRDFDEWMSHFRESIADYSYYIDFDKVVKNADSLKVEFNMMNSLIGSKDIVNDFINLVEKYPEVLKCVPILIAVRSKNIIATDENGTFDYNFDRPNYSPETYAYFMEKTGLFDMISNHLTNNLYDYALGVETGLDSNGRKNRGGHLMEDLVERFIAASGKKYHKEMYVEEIERKYRLDLSQISNHGKSTKRFDFVVEDNDCIIGVEVNFYASGGSKLNETARSYKMLAEESRDIKGFKFMWITDGKGWYSAKENLRETFDSMSELYNIKDLENGALNGFVNYRL